MRGSGRRDAGGLQRAARGAAVAPADEDARLWDDFRGGFSVGTLDAKWFYFASGSYVGDDGIAAPAGA